MKNFNEMDINKQKEIAQLFANWLEMYTTEVVISVMKKRDEIINNDFAMNLLSELKEREDKETKEFAHSIGNLMYDFDTFKDYNPHINTLTHANSYRDVLYDMFIKE